ncbi:MAG: TerB family tellurite resistance protein [Myxococcales bacterium]|nr:TerB family tellurite resistance protein [Myxococcales bacterium]
MKRLTISADACTETLVLLIIMAWADGKLEDREKEGVRAAASVFNLSKELRGRLDSLMENPLPVDELLVEALSDRERAFAYVAAAWVSGVDNDVDPKEKELLDRVADLFGFDDVRKDELTTIARDLEPGRASEVNWAAEIERLFRAIPPRLEHKAEGEDVEVAIG